MNIQNIPTLSFVFVLTVFSSQMGHSPNDTSGITSLLHIPAVLELIDNLKLPEGQRYEVMLPDALDLAERCRLAAKGMSWSVSDTEYDHEPYTLCLVW